MNKLLLLPVLLCISYFTWPVKSGRVTSSFAEFRPDHLHDGIDMISSSSDVYPVEDGDLLYMWNKELFPFDDYTGSGNYKLISHETYISQYLHLDDSSDSAKKVTTAEAIGKYANTGRSFGNHIHFCIIQPKDWSSINPFTLTQPIEDKRPPIISDLAFDIDGKIMIVKDKTTVRLTKDRPLLVKAFDEINKGDRLGIYTLKVYHNNKIIKDIKFEKIISKDGQLLMAGKKFDEIFNSSFYLINGIKWINGENSFSVRVIDYSGNESVKNFTLIANKEF
ncbi:MAG: M23 family metallopeptidase [Spirochaetes bacterium]|nr:M23 family metallopeptidase [Spirochaetota bacterium]